MLIEFLSLSFKQAPAKITNFFTSKKQDVNVNVDVVKTTTKEIVHHENNSMQEKDVAQTLMEEVSIVRKVSFVTFK